MHYNALILSSETTFWNVINSKSVQLDKNLIWRYEDSIIYHH